MSLCRYFPAPSDRMAIIWCLLTVKDGIVLEYGPAGTTHFSMGLYGELGIDFQQRLFTTHMSEDDVVMGDVSRLEKAIVELDQGYAPKILFVLASSTSAVIGTDIRGICNYMQKEVKCRLVSLENGGTRSDYSTGVLESCKLLVNNLTGPAEAMPGTYNIIGASMGSYRMASDIWEVQNLLDEAYGLKMHTCLCYNTSADDIATMSGAEINIVLSAEGVPAAEILQEKYGTPYVYSVPYGYTGTLTFLKEVGKTIGKMPPESLIGRIKGKIRGMSMFAMYSMMGGQFSQPPQAAIKGDYNLVCGLSAFLEEAGLTVPVKICSHSLKNIENPADDVAFYAVEKEWLDVLRPLEKTLVLADDVALLQCDESNTRLRVSSPFIEGSQVAQHLPFMGEKGADFLMEYIDLYYHSLT